FKKKFYGQTTNQNAKDSTLVDSANLCANLLDFVELHNLSFLQGTLLSVLSLLESPQAIGSILIKYLWDDSMLVDSLRGTLKKLYTRIETLDIEYYKELQNQKQIAKLNSIKNENQNEKMKWNFENQELYWKFLYETFNIAIGSQSLNNSQIIIPKIEEKTKKRESIRSSIDSTSNSRRIDRSSIQLSDITLSPTPKDQPYFGSPQAYKSVLSTSPTTNRVPSFNLQRSNSLSQISTNQLKNIHQTNQTQTTTTNTEIIKQSTKKINL